jgi:hypothetical protein
VAGVEGPRQKSTPRSGIPFAVHFPQVFELRCPVERAPAPLRLHAHPAFEFAAANSPRPAHDKQKLSPPALKRPVPNLSVTIRTGLSVFIQLARVLYLVCPSDQLFWSHRRATLGRKIKYEPAHTIAPLSRALELSGVYRGRLSVSEFRLFP